MEPEPKLIMKKRLGRPRKVRPVTMEAAKNGMSPLDYMLSIMRDPNATEQRRDRMAMAAAPYCHAKLFGAGPGKKDQRAEAAATAGVGTDWAEDLDADIRAN